jgi:CheY-like chemotaxis protein
MGSSAFASEDTMNTTGRDRILVVDDNAIVRETLAQRLRASGHEVLTATTGEQAFLALRDWSYLPGWLYTRAALPGLVDGWILSDAYHDLHPNRPAILSASAARSSAQGHIILGQPTVCAILDALRRAFASDGIAHVLGGYDDRQEAA